MFYFEYWAYYNNLQCKPYPHDDFLLLRLQYSPQWTKSTATCAYPHGSTTDLHMNPRHCYNLSHPIRSTRTCSPPNTYRLSNTIFGYFDQQSNCETATLVNNELTSRTTKHASTYSLSAATECPTRVFIYLSRTFGCKQIYQRRRSCWNRRQRQWHQRTDLLLI